MSSRARARWGWIVIAVLSVGCLAASLLLPFAYTEPLDNTVVIHFGPGFYVLLAGFALPWAAWVVRFCWPTTHARSGVGPSWKDWQECEATRSTED